MVKVERTVWAGFCLFLAGCVSGSDDQAKLSQKQLGSDFRLIFATESEIRALVMKEQCKLVVGSGSDLWQTNLSVGTGRKFSSILEAMGSNAFVMDSRVVVLKRDSIVRRPAWYETNNAQERTGFGATVVSPGDIVWFPPIPF